MFASEKELVARLKEVLMSSKVLLNVQNDEELSILEEVNVGFGIADLIISDLGTNKNRSFILSKLEQKIVSILKTQKSNVDIQFFYDNIKTSRKDLVLALDNLISLGIISLKGSFYKLVYGEVKDLNCKTIAVEAKLKNWKRALIQAYRYKWFAQESYVVLDSSFSNSAIKNICEFEKLNVGLAEISKDSELKVRYKPKKSQPFDLSMTLALNEKIVEAHLESRNDSQMSK